MAYLGHMVKGLRHTDTKMMCNKKARDVLETWAKQGAAGMGDTYVRLSGSVWGVPRRAAQMNRS